VLNAVAAERRTTAPVALRINPDVDARTHEKISTGKGENKFGLPLVRAREMYRLAAELPGIAPVGVDVHIGSQLTSLEPYAEAFGRIAELVRELRAEGHDIRRVDLGGGLGIPYRPEDPEPPHPERYAELAERFIGPLDCEVILEPGRLIAGNAGVLVSRVLYVKNTGNRAFVIADAAMNDLVRPAMYGAYHHILPVDEPPPDAALAPMDFVGPVCETGDTFARERPSPPLHAGDLISFMSAGAYGAVMASSYNSRPLVPEVLVDGDRFAVVRRRPTYEEMLAAEPLPEWLLG
jgi:diaminopimelate decarboxylase